MKFLMILALLLVVTNNCYGLYSSSGNVIQLTSSNFQSKVIDSDNLWIVEFYAPWCGHCKNLAPIYTNLANAVKGLYNVGAVDMDAYKDIGSPYGIKGFPTLKIFGYNKKAPEDYSGARTFDGMLDGLFTAGKKMVKDRSGGDSSGGEKKSSGSGGKKQDVVELTDDLFEKLVLDSEDMWLVEFYAPWCGHCKRLEPEWASAATQLLGKAKLGAVDATQFQRFSGKYGVQGFPTIKYFPAGRKTGDAEEYGGGRDAAGIVEWAMEKVSLNMPAPEVFELTSDDALKEACEGKQLCIFSFLPHILDTQASGRNEYIKILEDVADTYKRNAWGWVWAESVQQQKVEEAFGIGGFGYPALAVVNVRKEMFVLLKGPFSVGGVSELMRSVGVGRGQSEPIKGGKLPAVIKTEPWDGKDGQLPEEDDDKDEL